MAKSPAKPRGWSWEAPLALLVVEAAAAPLVVVLAAAVVVAPAAAGVVVAPVTVVVAVVDATVTPTGVELAATEAPAEADDPWTAEADAVKQLLSPDPTPTVIGPDAWVAPVLSLISSVIRVLATRATFHVREFADVVGNVTSGVALIWP